MSDWFIQPNITNYTGIVDYANSVTNDMFGVGIIWLVFIVVFSINSSSGTSPLKSVMVSGYISWVLSIMMSFLNWVEPYMVVIFAVIVAVSTMLSFYKGKEPWE